MTKHSAKAESIGIQPFLETTKYNAMKFWNYIGEFFLFRWLFGKLHHKEGQAHISKSSNQQSFLNDSFEDNDVRISSSNQSYHDYPSRYSHNDYDWDSHSLNDFDEGMDDYDVMDDF